MDSPPGRPSDVVGFGDFVLDLRAGELYRNGADRVRLPEQPFRVLVTLLRHPGEVVTRDALRHELWPNDTFVDFEHGLNSVIKRLRDTLGESAVAPHYIETIPKRGYRFIVPVVALASPPGTEAAGAPADMAHASAASPQRPDETTSRRRLVWFASAVAAIGLAAIGYFRQERSGVPPPPVVVVLPFTSLGAEGDGHFFVDGLTDEVIRSLAVIDGLQVRSRTSSFAFKDGPRDLQEVATRLGATHVVEGSVMGSGSRKRINVQFVDVAGDVPLWVGQFDRDIRSSGEVFEILDEISRAIVNELRLKLGRGQRRYDLDLQTYEMYLEGRELVARRGIPSAEAAGELFRAVIARDAAFAPAHAGLATAYALMLTPTSSRLSFADTHPLLRQAAQRALELDPMLAESHAAMGWVYSHEHAWASASRSFEKAIELDPSRTQTYTSYSISTLQPLGRFDEALRILEGARANDPLSLEVQREVGTVLLYAGRYAESIETLRRVVAVDRDYPFAELYLGRALTFAGRPAEALPLLERIDGRHLGRHRAPRTGRSVWLAQPYVMVGRRTEAETLAPEHDDSAASLAVIYAALGDRDRMFDALDRMADVAPHHVGRILLQPEIAVLRGDSRFATLRARCNLPSL